MTREMVFKEFRDFKITEIQVDKIVKFYRAGADVLGAIIGPRVLNEEMPLKLTLNSIKHTIVLMLELKNEKNKESS